MSPKTLECAKIGVGCLVDAINNVLEKKCRNAFCLLRPPGHHAEREKAMGFCFFSTVGIGAKYLKKIKQLYKIAIVDFDVHHGNGTQDVLWNDQTVFLYQFIKIKYFHLLEVKMKQE